MSKQINQDRLTSPILGEKNLRFEDLWISIINISNKACQCRNTDYWGMISSGINNIIVFLFKYYMYLTFFYQYSMFLLGKVTVSLVFLLRNVWLIAKYVNLNNFIRCTLTILSALMSTIWYNCFTLAIFTLVLQYVSYKYYVFALCCWYIIF